MLLAPHLGSNRSHSSSLGSAHQPTSQLSGLLARSCAGTCKHARTPYDSASLENTNMPFFLLVCFTAALSHELLAASPVHQDSCQLGFFAQTSLSCPESCHSFLPGPAASHSAAPHSSFGRGLVSGTPVPGQCPPVPLPRAPSLPGLPGCALERTDVPAICRLTWEHHEGRVSLHHLGCPSIKKCSRKKGKQSERQERRREGGRKEGKEVRLDGGRWGGPTCSETNQ